MRLYFAPMEGITGYIYRNLHSEMFGGCDAYYAPFITPSDNEKVSMKSLRDVVKENSFVDLKVQVLTNNAESFLGFEEKVIAAGYDEININLGCPSGTVVKKNRGAGFLRDADLLDRFLCEVFEKTKVKVSVKTRTGFLDGGEMDELIKVYNKYPICQLTVHPRTRADFYKGEPDIMVFEGAYNRSVNPVCYNGNVFSVEDYNRITEKYPKLEGVMLGRGAISNPAIFREIRGGDKLRTKELVEFTSVLAERYNEVFKTDVYTLNKLKEIWIYMMWNFPDEEKILKAIKKAGKVHDIENAVAMLPELR